MTESGFYQRLLLLKEGWEVKEVKVDHTNKEVDVYIEYTKEKAVCPITNELSKIYDYRANRRWRHLDTMQYKTYKRVILLRRTLVPHHVMQHYLQLVTYNLFYILNYIPH